VLIFDNVKMLSRNIVHLEFLSTSDGQGGECEDETRLKA